MTAALRASTQRAAECRPMNASRSNRVRPAWPRGQQHVIPGTATPWRAAHRSSSGRMNPDRTWGDLVHIRSRHLWGLEPATTEHACHKGAAISSEMLENALGSRHVLGPILQFLKAGGCRCLAGRRIGLRRRPTEGTWAVTAPAAASSLRRRNIASLTAPCCEVAVARSLRRPASASALLRPRVGAGPHRLDAVRGRWRRRRRGGRGGRCRCRRRRRRRRCRRHRHRHRRRRRRTPFTKLVLLSPPSYTGLPGLNVASPHAGSLLDAYVSFLPRASTCPSPKCPGASPRGCAMPIQGKICACLPWMHPLQVLTNPLLPLNFQADASIV